MGRQKAHLGQVGVVRCKFLEPAQGEPGRVNGHACLDHASQPILRFGEFAVLRVQQAQQICGSRVLLIGLGQLLQKGERLFLAAEFGQRFAIHRLRLERA